MGAFMSWSEYEKWSFSLTKDVLAHLQFLVCCLVFGFSRRLLEVGSGTGLQSTFLSYFGGEVVSVDLYRQVARMARDVSRYYKGREVAFVVADARFLPFKADSFGLCFSQGLLEHLSDRTIVDIVCEAKRVALDKLLFSVPSANFPEQDFGDERLMFPYQWRVILSQFGARVHYYFFDFQALKCMFVNRRMCRPWHIQIEI